MNESRQTRHDLYDYLQAIGLKVDHWHKQRIRDFMLQHAGKVVKEMRQEAQFMQQALLRKNQRIQMYFDKYGPLSIEENHALTKKELKDGGQMRILFAKDRDVHTANGAE